MMDIATASESTEDLQPGEDWGTTNVSDSSEAADAPTSEETLTWLKQEARIAESPALREVATLLVSVKTIIDADQAHLNEMDERMSGFGSPTTADPPAQLDGVATASRQPTNESALQRVLRLTYPSWCRIARIFEVERRRGAEEMMSSTEVLPLATKTMQRAYRMLVHTNISGWLQDVVDCSTGDTDFERIILYIGYLLVTTCGPQIVEEYDESPDVLPLLRDSLNSARRLPATELLHHLVTSDDGVLSSLLSSEMHYVLFDRLHTHVFRCTASERAQRRTRGAARLVSESSPGLVDRILARGGLQRRESATAPAVGMKVVLVDHSAHRGQDATSNLDPSRPPNVGVIVRVLRSEGMRPARKSHRHEATGTVERRPVRLTDEFDTADGVPTAKRRKPPPFVMLDEKPEARVLVVWPDRHDRRVFLYRLGCDVIFEDEYKAMQLLTPSEIDWDLEETLSLLGAAAQVCTTREAIGTALQLGLHSVACHLLSAGESHPLVALRALGLIDALSRHSRCVIPMHDRDVTQKVLRAAEAGAYLTATTDSSPRRKASCGVSFVPGQQVPNGALRVAAAACLASLVATPAGVVAFGEHPSPRRHTADVVRWMGGLFQDAPPLQSSAANFFAGALHIPLVITSIDQFTGESFAQRLVQLLKLDDDSLLLEEPFLSRLLAAACALCSWVKVKLYSTLWGYCCTSQGLKPFMTRSSTSVWPQGTSTLSAFVSALGRNVSDVMADIEGAFASNAFGYCERNAQQTNCAAAAQAALQIASRADASSMYCLADMLTLLADSPNMTSLRELITSQDSIALMLMALRKCRTELRRERQSSILTLFRLLAVVPAARVTLLAARTLSAATPTSLMSEIVDALKDTDTTVNVRGLDVLGVLLLPTSSTDPSGSGSPTALALAVLRSCDGLNTLVSHLVRPLRADESDSHGGQPARVRGQLRVAARSMRILAAACCVETLRGVLREVGVIKAASDLVAKCSEPFMQRDPSLRQKLEVAAQQLVTVVENGAQFVISNASVAASVREASIDSNSAIHRPIVAPGVIGTHAALVGAHAPTTVPQINIDTSSLDSLVADYCLRRGYTSASDAIRREAKLPEIQVMPSRINHTLEEALTEYVKFQHLAHCASHVAFVPPVDVSVPHQCPQYESSGLVAETLSWSGRRTTDVQTRGSWARREPGRAMHSSYASLRGFRHRFHRHIYDARPGGDWSNPTCIRFTDFGRLLLMGTNYGDLAHFEMTGDVFDDSSVESTVLYDGSFPERIDVSRCGSLISFALSDGLTVVCNRSEMPMQFVDYAARAATFSFDASRVVFTPTGSAEGASSCVVVDVNRPGEKIHLRDEMRHVNAASEVDDEVWIASFDPTGNLVLGDAALWDLRVSRNFPLARFDKFSIQNCHSSFHPAGHAVIVDCHVWEMRSMRILHDVEALRGASAPPMFAGTHNEVFYAWRKFDTMSVVDVLDSSDFSPLSSFTIRHTVTHLTVDPSGDRVAAIADTPAGESIVKVYRSGVESGTGPTGVLIDEGERDDEDGYSVNSSESARRSDATTENGGEEDEDDDEDEDEDEDDEDGSESSDSTADGEDASGESADSDDSSE